jgi:alanine or glycine:cation symporter, AGCS family
MEWIGEFMSRLSGFVWGIPLVALLFGTHLYLTWKTGFIQLKLPLA